MDIEALNQFSKDELIALPLAHEARTAVNSSSLGEPSAGAQKGHLAEALYPIENHVKSNTDDRGSIGKVD